MTIDTITIKTINMIYKLSSSSLGSSFLGSSRFITLTLTVSENSLSSVLAVIVVSPSLIPLIIPPLLTVTILGLELS